MHRHPVSVQLGFPQSPDSTGPGDTNNHQDDTTTAHASQGHRHPKPVKSAQSHEGRGLSFFLHTRKLKSREVRPLPRITQLRGRTQT